MLDTNLLQSVAMQLLSGDSVEVDGKHLAVRRTRTSRLRCLSFEMDGCRFEAIEQNPAKPSRWGQLARAGHQVVQFKQGARFVAVAVDGKITVYCSGSRRPTGSAGS